VSTKAQELLSTTASKSEPVRILVADDQADVREALRLLLKAEGYSAETISSPAAALEAVQTNEFDIMLMDLNYQRDTTSGQEGIDLLSRVLRFPAATSAAPKKDWTFHARRPSMVAISEEVHAVLCPCRSSATIQIRS